MFRSTSYLTALVVAAVASAQPSLLTRVDSVPDSVQLTFRNQSLSSFSPNAAWVTLPSQSQPNYNFGYAITGPTVGARRAIVSNEVYNRNVFSNRDILMSFTGSADVPIALAFGMTLGFVVLCIAIVAVIFKTGWRLRG